MKKKIKVTILIILTFLCLIQIIIVTSNKIDIHSKAEKYLITTKGYTTKDIKHIKVEHTYMGKILGSGEYSLSVIFTDEPKATYWYDYKNIHQTGISGMPFDGRVYKHAEDESLKYLYDK
ncbi:DUF3139 domain-containing protein [Clostridium sp. AWRP]|uniref:DUF3139 domain-containing protein n=1 Tax=Clostridium sp. AWRP TaxID=2212991 RepID=UPI000FD6DEBE|nr:DUF3139 domain-containing protein [Clostridium sp. AWRP]AZV57964.1 DUF3139 domain-containing protein [Clostridium sp. AWRP]